MQPSFTAPSSRTILGWRTLVALVFVALVLGAGSARAQECPEPPLRGPMTVTPSDGAPGVTLDAPVFVDYAEGYFGPDGPGEDPTTLITLEQCGACTAFCSPGSGTPVTGLVQVHGDRLYFVPDVPLAENTQYLGTATGIETSLDFSFCTGRGFDSEPPVLDGAPRPSSTRVGPQCNLPDGGYRLAVSFAPATDDGPPGSIEYLLYLSRGDSVDAPVVVSRARNYASADITLGVLLSPEATRTPICLTLAASDGVGNVTVADQSQCFDPITRTTFSGACNAQPGRPRGWGVLGLVGLVGLLLSMRRR